ncbi:hypothetical protein glysoja_047367 [Glycine soja]|uniref:Uncharacterized protein n=1 Tax=Glycine soja TaxID=3848 RepID=A0A0B2PCB5_GLYSO|nr:hypothetical protein glysoja_047367 [Glycine soja]
MATNLPATKSTTTTTSLQEKRHRSIFEVPPNFFDCCRLLPSPHSSVSDHYSVKLTIAGKNIVKEEDFKVLTSEFVKDYDVSKNEVVEKLKSLTAEPRDNTYLRIVLVASGGHFAVILILAIYYEE